jgi:hypothetical protein
VLVVTLLDTPVWGPSDACSIGYHLVQETTEWLEDAAPRYGMELIDHLGPYFVCVGLEDSDAESAALLGMDLFETLSNVCDFELCTCRMAVTVGPVLTLPVGPRQRTAVGPALIEANELCKCIPTSYYMCNEAMYVALKDNPRVPTEVLKFETLTRYSIPHAARISRNK